MYPDSGLICCPICETYPILIGEDKIKLSCQKCGQLNYEKVMIWLKSYGKVKYNV